MGCVCASGVNASAVGLCKQNIKHHTNSNERQMTPGTRRLRLSNVRGDDEVRSIAEDKASMAGHEWNAASCEGCADDLGVLVGHGEVDV